MPLDIALLATTVVSNFLMPYVKDGAQKMAETVTARLGDQAAEHAVGVTDKLWQRIKEVFSDDKEKKALELFEDDPDELSGKLAKILQQKLEHDSRLADEVQTLVNSPSASGVGSGAQIISATYASIFDGRGADFRGGIQTAMIVGNVSEAPPNRPADPNASSLHDDDN